MFRNLLDILNEAFAPVDVDSSHIQSIEHNGEKLYVHFLDGAIYEYDDVTEDMARQMLNAPSKGGFMWQNIRDRYPYRRVTSVPAGAEQPSPEQPDTAVKMSYDQETDQWVEDPASTQQAVDTSSVEVPRGYQFRAPDGDNYIWKGALWVNTRTGRIAKRAIGQKITDISKRLIQLKGDAGASDDLEGTI